MPTPEKKKQKQKMRYSDGELELIKTLFAEEEDLPKAIRKHFLQMPLEIHEQHLLTKAFTEIPANAALLRKAYLPTLDPEAPVNQLVDLWMTVQIADKSPEAAYPHLMARELLISYLDQQLKAIEEGQFDHSKAGIQLSSLVNGIVGRDVLDVYVELTARNTLVSHNEQQLQMLNILSGTKKETVEETKRRLEQDSNR